MVDRFIGNYVVTFCILAFDADKPAAYLDMRGFQNCGYSELIFFSCLHLYHILNFCFPACISITFWDASVHHETRNCQTICSWKIQITNFLVFLLASISHFELHVHTIQPQGAERLVPEKYKSRITDLLIFLLASISHFELHLYTMLQRQLPNDLSLKITNHRV